MYSLPKPFKVAKRLGCWNSKNKVVCEAVKHCSVFTDTRTIALCPGTAHAWNNQFFHIARGEQLDRTWKQSYKEGSVKNSSCQEADPDEHEQAIQPWHNQGANTRRRLPLSYSQFTVQMCIIHCLVCETNLTSRQSASTHRSCQHLDNHADTQLHTVTYTTKSNCKACVYRCTGGALVSFVCFHVDQAENQVNRCPLLKHIPGHTIIMCSQVHSAHKCIFATKLWFACGCYGTLNEAHKKGTFRC